MHTYLRRFFSYILLSFGIALLLGPYIGNPFENKIQIEKREFCEKYPLSCKQTKLEKRNEAFFDNKKFTTTKYILSLLLIGFGFLLLQKDYKKNIPGIPLNPQWAKKLNDGISIIFLSFAAYCIWAWGFYQLFEVESYLCDTDTKSEGIMVITSLFYLPTVAILAFFVSNLSNQSIKIEEEGITLYYPEKIKKINWKEIIKLKISNTFTITGGEDWVAPRELQSKLSIQTQENSFALYEPGLKRSKKQIVKYLQKYAPERLQKDILTLQKEWL